MVVKNTTASRFQQLENDKVKSKKPSYGTTVIAKRLAPTLPRITKFYSD